MDSWSPFAYTEGNNQSGEGYTKPAGSDPDYTKEYKACPESKKKLDDSISEHANDDYSLNNRKSRNCTGWACERLRDTGFEPPISPDTPMLRPDDIGGGPGANDFNPPDEGGKK